jgi:excisionase family DNA binding protein
VIADRLPLRTPAQAAQLLAVPESWLRRKAAARTIPCTFLGKHLRFSPADLVAITTCGGQPSSTRNPTAVRRVSRTR